MKNEKNLCKRICVVPLHAVQESIDPAELWLDDSIEPEALIDLDPLDIDAEMVEQAEQPELADPLLVSLRERPTTVWSEEAWLKQHRAQAKDSEAWRKLVKLFSGSK